MTAVAAAGGDAAAIDVLRSLVVDGRVPSACRRDRPELSVADLDDKLRAMVGLAAVIATGGGSCSYRLCVERATAAGASDEEIVDVLVELASIIGLYRLASATTELAAALGYDIDRALEGLDSPNDSNLPGSHC